LFLALVRADPGLFIQIIMKALSLIVPGLNQRIEVSVAEATQVRPSQIKSLKLLVLREYWPAEAHPVELISNLRLFCMAVELVDSKTIAECIKKPQAVLHVQVVKLSDSGTKPMLETSSTCCSCLLI
jgi:hypothetical protein